MTERAEQMVLDYLSRAADAAQGHVGTRQRAAYLDDLRSRINAARVGAKAATPEDVHRVLQRFGDPEDLVARELASASEADDAEPAASGAGSGTRRPLREPPPWRGGHEGNWLGWESSPRPPRRGSTGGRVPALLLALRRYPAEILAVVIYLASGALGAVALVWVVGAALVVLSKAWASADKWVALGVPVAATVVGMLLWRGEAPYVDQIVLRSLLDTGVIGLRVAALACGVYLGVRTARLARSAAV